MSDTLPFREIASSPPPATSRPNSSSSRKVKKPPPITPKRFTKFFTPKSASAAVAGTSLSHSARQLRDITHSAACSSRGNSVLPSTPRSVQSWLFAEDDENYESGMMATPLRQRKRACPMTPPDSSPSRFSPTKRIRALPMDCASVIVEEDEEDEADGVFQLPLPPLDFSHFLPPCQSVQRLDYQSTAMKLLEQSFGLSMPLTRPHTDYSRGVGRGVCSGFYSRSDNTYAFPEKSVPFCVATGNYSCVAAIGDEAGGIRLFDTAADFSTPKIELQAHENAVVDLAFSPSDDLLATASGDHSCHIIDVRTQQTKYVMSGHLGSVKQIRFQPADPNILASSSRDGSIQIWDLRCSGSEVGLLETGPSINQSTRPFTTPRYASPYNTILRGHSSFGASASTSSKAESASLRRLGASVTALSFLDPSRPHFILSGSEASTSLRLWDIRARYSRHRECLPISSTQEPAWHSRHRHFGINNIVVGSGGGAPCSRVYALSRDSTVYAYSASHLILGHAPQLERDIEPKYRISSADSRTGLAPLYGLRHPNLHVTSFFVKASLRPATLSSPELLAVGNSNGFPVLFNTDEAACRKSPASVETLPAPMVSSRRASSATGAPLSNSQPSTPLSTRFSPALGFPPGALSSPIPFSATLSLNSTSVPSSTITAGFPSSARPETDDSIPTYDTGVALEHAYKVEVSALEWDMHGRLVTIGDDTSARLWENDAEMARSIRALPLGHTSRAGVGVAAAVDDEDGDEDAIVRMTDADWEDVIIKEDSVGW